MEKSKTTKHYMAKKMRNLAYKGNFVNRHQRKAVERGDEEKAEEYVRRHGERSTQPIEY